MFLLVWGYTRESDGWEQVPFTLQSIISLMQWTSLPLMVKSRGYWLPSFCERDLVVCTPWTKHSKLLFSGWSGCVCRLLGTYARSESREEDHGCPSFETQLVRRGLMTGGDQIEFIVSCHNLGYIANLSTRTLYMKILGNNMF